MSIGSKIDLNAMANNEKAIMKIKGKLVKLQIKTDHTLHNKFVTMDKGKNVLYDDILKALYKLLKSYLLLYKKNAKGLNAIGFKLNPYDVCAANRIVNEKQYTMVWHFYYVK